MTACHSEVVIVLLCFVNLASQAVARNAISFPVRQRLWCAVTSIMMRGTCSCKLSDDFPSLNHTTTIDANADNTCREACLSHFLECR
ncbi:hypothetical protein B0H63DRAFT_488152 [Podospora didyma]|uniref:Secreted protein n=1 Tax=Podospora didyma TaxID=330526 RepID=A0AAE0K1E4_9PEZI|nr:hypothetical protein B0H63DRAFT_488152 [Podospora didyma]